MAYMKRLLEDLGEGVPLNTTNRHTLIARLEIASRWPAKGIHYLGYNSEDEIVLLGYVKKDHDLNRYRTVVWGKDTKPVRYTAHPNYRGKILLKYRMWR